ncbi:MAG: flagellar basal body P-ring formation chaperone FlgA [Phycisphaerales bacterium]|jgi:flagella basal body P-ring formation protein FlgA
MTTTIPSTTRVRPHAWPSPASPRRVASLVLLVALALMAIFSARSAQAQGDTIALRPAVTLDASRPLTLADVADISGDEAQKASGVVVSADRVTEGSRIDIPTIRRALEADKAINLGRIRLTGGVCVVRIGAGAPVANSRWAPVPSAVVATPGVESVRDRITRHLADLFNISVDDLRLSFEDNDAPLLARAIGVSTVSVQPQGSGDRIPLAIRMYEGDRLTVSGSIRVGVEVRRPVLVASKPIARGDIIDADTTTNDRQWLPASATPANPDDAVGQLARAPVRAGEVIGLRDIEPPIVIKKGDLVAVDCICGGVVVRASLRAMESGREGDVIQFKPATSKTIIRAKVSGPGVAVINAPSGLSDAGLALGGGR